MGRRRNGSGTLYRRGAVYYAQITVGGKTLRLSTGETSKARATARLNSLARGFDLSDRERLAAVRAALQREGDATVGEAWGLYEKSPRFPAEPSRRASRRAAWRRFRAWAVRGIPTVDGRRIPPALPGLRTLGDVGDAEAARFVSEAGKLWAGATVRSTACGLARMWEALRVADNPWRGVLLPARGGPGAVRRALTDGELREVIGRAEGELRTLFMIGAYTGLRLSDAARLRWEDVPGEMRAVSVIPAKTRRTSGAAVAVPVHPALRAELEAALEAAGGRGKAGEYVTPGLAALRRSMLSRAVQAHFRACGLEASRKVEGYRHRVPEIGFHSLRATFVTRLADAGAPLAQIRGLVGHVSEEMTMRYYRQDAETARWAVERLPWPGGGAGGAGARAENGAEPDGGGRERKGAKV